MDVLIDLDFFTGILEQMIVYGLFGGFIIATIFIFLSFGIFKALSLLNIK